jgi:hypothetical protein
MKAIVRTDHAVGTAAMELVKRNEPQAPISDVVVQDHASRFAPTKRACPPTWTDRLDRDRTPSIPGHELARHEAAVIGISDGVMFSAARLCRDVVYA